MPVSRRPVLPVRNGVAASRVTLTAGAWPSLLDFLLERFPRIDAATWYARFERGLVLDDDGLTLRADSGCRTGAGVHYYREVADEPAIAGTEEILFHDADLLVADKPHFLAVAPSGRYAQETLLARLRRRCGLDDLAPLHRLDRGTAGVIAFSVNPATRSDYQALLRTGAVDKVYEALAPALPDIDFPLTRRSRIVAGEPFFRMGEVDGEPNSETRIEVLARRGARWLYRLLPTTGRKHQLRVHLAALGAGIENDPLYPDLQAQAPEDVARPLRLLARELAFTDPLTGARRVFRSGRVLG